MSADKKVLTMSARSFLDKANAAKSAEAFLTAHWEYLTTGELAEKISPFITQFKANTLPPNITLNVIKSAVFSHMLLTQNEKAEEKIEKARKQAPGPTKNKPYIGVVYAPSELKSSIDADGNATVVTTRIIATKKNDKGEDIDIQDVFESPQSAARWVNRRLAEGLPVWSGEVIWSKILLKDGLPMVDSISYDQAVAAMNPKGRTPFMHVNKVNGRLTGQMKVGQTKSSFSKG